MVLLFYNPIYLRFFYANLNIYLSIDFGYKFYNSTNSSIKFAYINLFSKSAEFILCRK